MKLALWTLLTFERRALAPGAANLIPELVAKGMPPVTTSVNQLTMEHWTILSNVYDAWPFKSAVSALVPPKAPRLIVALRPGSVRRCSVSAGGLRCDSDGRDLVVALRRK